MPRSGTNGSYNFYIHSVFNFLKLSIPISKVAVLISTPTNCNKDYSFPTFSSAFFISFKTKQNCVCVSPSSVAVVKHHDEDNMYKEEFNWGLLVTVTEC